MPESKYSDWRAQSKCQTLTPTQYDNLFFPNSGRSIMKAKAFCRECPVKEMCLEFALNTKACGIWAGTNEKERSGILKFRARVNAVTVTAAAYISTKPARNTARKRKRNVVFH